MTRLLLVLCLISVQAFADVRPLKIDITPAQFESQYNMKMNQIAAHPDSIIKETTTVKNETGVTHIMTVGTPGIELRTDAGDKMSNLILVLQIDQPAFNNAIAGQVGIGAILVIDQSARLGHISNFMMDGILAAAETGSHTAYTDDCMYIFTVHDHTIRIVITPR